MVVHPVGMVVHPTVLASDSVGEPFNRGSTDKIAEFTAPRSECTTKLTELVASQTECTARGSECTARITECAAQISELNDKVTGWNGISGELIAKVAQRTTVGTRYTASLTKSDCPK